MATSGIYSVQYNRDQLITASLRKLGVIAEGQSPSAQNITDGAMALNSTITMLKTKGMALWTRVEYTFTPTTGSYLIGDGQTLNTQFPVKLLQVIRNESGGKIDMDIVSRDEFNILPANSTGNPIKVNYQPFINYGRVSLWPTPDSTNTSTITLVYNKPFQVFTSASETLDFPEEWYNAIVYNTAVLLAPEWGVPITDRQMLKAEAKEYLELAMENGGEDASLFIQPERRM